MVMRVALATGMVASLMAMVANGGLLQRVGLKSSCSVMHLNAGTQLTSCRSGWLNGFPNLAARGCTNVGAARHEQYWSCPAS